MSKRITFVFLVFVVFFLAIVSKAFYIQIYNQKTLKNYAQSQVLRKEVIHPKRASVFDRNGAPLAINITAYNLFMMPQDIQLTAEGIRKLVDIIPTLNYEKIRKDVITRKKFTWISRKQKLNEDQLKKLKKIKGLNIDRTVKRYYPNGELLAQTLGFVGIDNKGLAGLEYKLDERLRGKKIVTSYYKDAKGRPIKIESQEFEEKNTDLHLSVEIDVQNILEQSLQEAVKKHKADLGGAAVLNANTGEIIAMANYPTFNPNEYSKSKISQRKLSYVTDPFEPGSTMKLLTVASALSFQTAQSKSMYYCEKGDYKIGKHKIREADTKKKFEWLSVSDIIKYSSNIGTTKIAFDLGYKNLKNTFDKFRIGRKTGIELPAESKGIFRNGENISRIKLSNMSFGQGVATTGLQMLAAYGAIANGGYYIKPTLLKRDKTAEKEKILDSNVVDQLREMLIKAVTDGTGKKAMIKNIDIGGKTSTAQRVSKDGGYEGYVPGFAGITFGTETPYVTLVYVDNPKEGGYYGNTVAAPVYKKITEYLLFKHTKNYRDEAVSEKIIKPASVKVVKEKVKTQIKTNAKVKSKKTKVVRKGITPNFIGLDRASVEELAASKNLEVEINGYGLVYSQSPKAGEKSAQKIKVKLKAPTYD